MGILKRIFKITIVRFEYMVKINSDGDFYNNSNIDNSWVALFFSTGIFRRVSIFMLFLLF